MTRTTIVAEPKQNRSRQTRDRICRAMRELLEEKPYHAISMEELALRAGCSNSSLYSRFSSKLALLQYLHEEAVEDATRSLALLERKRQPVGVAKLAETITRNYLDFRRRHWAVLRAARDLESEDATIRARRARHDQQGFTKVRNALVACAAAEGSKISAEQLDRSIMMVAGAIRSIVDDPGHGAHSTRDWEGEDRREVEIARFVRAALEGLLGAERQDDSPSDERDGRAGRSVASA